MTNHARPAALAPLAIVGIGCRFPGGCDTPSALWQGLLGRLDALGDVPLDRFHAKNLHDPSGAARGSLKSTRGGFLPDVAGFDAAFFSMFPSAADRTDPQQRLLLEVAFEAFEDAGLPLEQLRGSRTAVFMGSFMYDYLCLLGAEQARDEMSPYTAMGTAMCSIANRLSWFYDLRGPSLTVDSACSSSLVAAHLACQAIWRGEATQAVAGGVNVMLRPGGSVMLSSAGFLSPDGQCRAFDAKGRGYVRSEGAGVVVIKRLDAALADGDHVYCVIRGSAVNSDGNTPEGLTVPSPEAQAALLRDAYAAAGVAPAAVAYVEAHGPGTVVGDPIETAALGEVLGAGREAEQPLLIGSIKTNLGHLEGASGIAGLIKAALVAEHRLAPPNLHFDTPNPAIDFGRHRLRVPTEATPLGDGDVLVGVNSFGAGGTNAHLVLQAPPAPRPAAANPVDDARDLPVLVSGHTPAAVRQRAEQLGAWVEAHPEVQLTAVARTTHRRQTRLSHTVALPSTSRRAFSEACGRVAQGELAPSRRVLPDGTTGRLAFVYSGQGGQWPRMGLALAASEPVFAAALSDVDRRFAALAGFSLLEHLGRAPEVSRLDDTVVVQPAIFAVQVALTELLRHQGLFPAAVAGHSIGEVAAAWAAGALDLDDAVAVIYHRSQVQDRASGAGGMLFAAIDEARARRLLAGRAAAVSVATINGPAALTLAGDAAPLAAIRAELEAEGVFVRPVNVQVPYHSHHMEPLRAELVARLDRFAGRAAAVPLYSTVTAKRADGRHLDGSYWFRNVRDTVRYQDTVDAMLDDGCNVFVEIGPHPVLATPTAAQAELRGRPAVAVAAMQRQGDGVEAVRQAAQAWLANAPAPHERAVRGVVGLPSYPWQHTRHWFEPVGGEASRVAEGEHPMLRRRTQLATELSHQVVDLRLGLGVMPWLAAHRVQGEAVFPATGHLEVARAVARQVYPHADVVLEDLAFRSALVLPEADETPLECRLEITSNEGRYVIVSRPAGDANAAWSTHSAGRFNALGDGAPAGDAMGDADLTAARVGLRDVHRIDVDDYYRTLAAAGLDYGDSFRCLRELWHDGQRIVARLELRGAQRDEARGYGFHPALLDACAHAVFAELRLQGCVERVYIPHEVRRVWMGTPPAVDAVLWAVVTPSRCDDEWLVADVTVFVEDGTASSAAVCARVEGLRCKRLTGAEEGAAAAAGTWEERWVPAAPPAGELRYERGMQHLVVHGERAAWVDDLLDEVRRAVPNVRIWPAADGVLPDVALDRRTHVLLLPTAEPETEAPEAAALEQGVWERCGALLAIAKACVEREGVPNLHVVTLGAHGVGGEGGAPRLSEAAVAAMARVVANECPTVRVFNVDLSEQPGQAERRGLVEHLLFGALDRNDAEVALRQENRWVRQLHAVDLDERDRADAARLPSCGGPFSAALSQAGALETLHWRATTRRGPRGDEVAIAVHASALNFKDVLNGIGLLGQDAVAGGLAGARLGLEVAGVVEAVGPEVHDLAPGDAVMARVADGFAGRCLARRAHVARKPQALSWSQAAAVPVVFTTAWYSLAHLARVRPGETVLVHSATGGVGLAALAVARHLGATVIATAGSPQKRALLQELGVEHVFDSRSLSFYDGVMAATGGRGVDVVLNSLSGKLLTQSLRCVAPFGRFVELGKADVYANAKLDVVRLGDNVSLSVVDVDRLAKQRPELHQQLLAEITALLDRGALAPIPVTELPMSRLSEALQQLRRGGHVGKVVVRTEGDEVEVLPALAPHLRPDRTYWISGGTGGFGLELARWMVERGARHLVLVSRSGVRHARDQQVVERLRAEGVEVWVERLDVADAAAVSALVDRVQRTLPALAGIVHGAAVLDDANVVNVTEPQFRGVLRPKAIGAWNLHRASLEHHLELDHFVMLSSISVTLGIVGQASYVAANAVQDALAALRQSQGLAGTSLGLGLLGEYAGMSRRENDGGGILMMLKGIGVTPMPLSETLELVGRTLVHGPAARACARVDWRAFARGYAHLAKDTRLLAVVGEAGQAGAGAARAGVRADVLAAAPAERPGRLTGHLAAALARILGIDAAALDTSVTLDRLSLDSLVLNQLRAWLLRQLDINYPLIKLIRGPSLAGLAAELVGRLAGGAAGADVAAAGAGDVSWRLEDEAGLTVPSPWLVRGRSSGDEPVRLIAFHSMGTGASLFTRFLFDPPAGVDLVAVQTPGRENRAHEPVAPHVDALVDGIVEALTPLLDRPFVFWGHSFGGIVAYEVIRRLEARGSRLPEHFVVTGTIAPSLISVWQRRDVLLRVLLDDNSTEYLMALSRYVDDADFVASIVPLLRKDTQLLLSYRHRHKGRLSVGVTAYAARQDEVVYRDELGRWTDVAAQVEVRDVDGDHWFLNRNFEALRADLAGLAEAARPVNQERREGGTTWRAFAAAPMR